MTYCDLSCKYAEFPDKLSDGSGSCRTFVGIYCTKLKQLVDKNGPCRYEIESEEKDDKSE